MMTQCTCLRDPLSGTLMSYAKDSQAALQSQRSADFNHFVVSSTCLLSAYACA